MMLLDQIVASVAIWRAGKLADARRMLADAGCVGGAATGLLQVNFPDGRTVQYVTEDTAPPMGPDIGPPGRGWRSAASPAIPWVQVDDISGEKAPLGGKRWKCDVGIATALAALNAACDSAAPGLCDQLVRECISLAKRLGMRVRTPRGWQTLEQLAVENNVGMAVLTAARRVGPHSYAGQAVEVLRCALREESKRSVDSDATSDASAGRRSRRTDQRQAQRLRRRLRLPGDVEVAFTDKRARQKLYAEGFSYGRLFERDATRFFVMHAPGLEPHALRSAYADAIERDRKGGKEARLLRRMLIQRMCRADERLDHPSAARKLRRWVAEPQRYRDQIRAADFDTVVALGKLSHERRSVRRSR